jgi:hypothetical protein
MSQLTLYKKIGKRYVKHDDYLEPAGLPCGLYLFYKPNHTGEHKAMINIMHYAKVHDIKNVGRFSDLIAGHEDILLRVISDIIFKGNYSASELTNAILTEISKI